MSFLSIRIGPAMKPHCTTGRTPREKPRRLFPSRTVAPLRRLSRFLGRHQPTNMVEFENIDMVTAPLLNISSKYLWSLAVLCCTLMNFHSNPSSIIYRCTKDGSMMSIMNFIMGSNYNNHEALRPDCR
ncbi:hypothetical protein TorRG33x02_269700, partial [Trema orientale]